MDFGWLSQGVQPVQLADPMRMAAQGMTLADLARRNRQGEEDERFKMLERQSDTLAAQGLMRARQGGDPNAVFADLQQQGEAGALAARKIAKFMDDQSKSQAETRYKDAQTNEHTANADSKRTNAKLDSLKQFATLTTAIASGQAPVNGNTQGAVYEVAASILPPEIVRTMPADPAKFREWAAVMADPNTLSKIAAEHETGRHNLATEGLTASGQAETGRHNRTSEGIAGGHLTLARDKEGRDRAEGGKPPSGYRWKPDGSLEAITGGPHDPASGRAPEAYNKQSSGIANLNTAITEYQSALKDFGTMDMLSPDARAAMGTKYNNMMLQAKEAYNLGVLNGPDYSILQSVVADPTSMRGAVTSNAALSTQASELGRIMKQNQANLDKVYKQKSAPAADRDSLVRDAMDAISRGAPRDKVMQRLKEKGITDAQL